MSMLVGSALLFNSPSSISLHILSKIVLADLHDLLSPASIAELSWACGRVFHHVFGVRISLY